MKTNDIIQEKRINTNELFRLPWSKSDNAMTWFEPTRYCNLKCDGCFQHHEKSSAKTLFAIEQEIRTMLSLRKCDAMIIAGGEPLTHPDLLDITRMVKSYKVKPVIFTNGIGLDEEFARKLKKAGMFGFTFHIDAHQARPGWEGKSEKELNELRYHYAKMIKNIGGLSCSFNTTIYPDTIQSIPDIVEWASRNIDIVQVLTLIAIRTGHPDDGRVYHVGEEIIDIGDTAYGSHDAYEKLTSEDLYEQVLKVLPDFKICAYLGGTALPAAPKWAIGNQVSSKKRNYGSTGGRSMELLQNISHFFRGSYLAFSKPSINRMGRSMLLFSLFDKNIRKTSRRYFSAILRNPLRLFRKLYVQTISIVQPVDILDTGEKDNCDGCPNMTLWNGRLVTACRLDEYLKYGAPISIMPVKS
jgi:hypothetical protein